MKIHLRTCPDCKIVKVRIHGDTQWLTWTYGPITEHVRIMHEIASETEISCLECKVHEVAVLAGSVT